MKFIRTCLKTKQTNSLAFIGLRRILKFPDIGCSPICIVQLLGATSTYCSSIFSICWHCWLLSTWIEPFRCEFISVNWNAPICADARASLMHVCNHLYSFDRIGCSCCQMNFIYFVITHCPMFSLQETWPFDSHQCTCVRWISVRWIFGFKNLNWMIDIMIAQHTVLPSFRIDFYFNTMIVMMIKYGAPMHFSLGIFHWMQFPMLSSSEKLNWAISSRNKPLHVISTIRTLSQFYFPGNYKTTGTVWSCWALTRQCVRFELLKEQTVIH